LAADKAKYIGTGRRKSSVARVELTSPGKGKIFINGVNIEDYIPRESLITVIKQPLVALDQESGYDIKVNVNGGGLSGQSGAIRLGLSRALLQVNSDNRSLLKSSGLLTRDARKVERKKPGQPGARKKFQFSKR
jgi:small subunit ribosomal protein S9|tara:strand:+ start:1006 stop:1407 length:402 start_codon:yes stop_codon:yes gene_type:complete